MLKDWASTSLLPAGPALEILDSNLSVQTDGPGNDVLQPYDQNPADLPAEQLDGMIEQYPWWQTRNMAETRQKIEAHVWDSAFASGYSAADRTDAFRFWDAAARAHGQGSLETLLMRRKGYMASTFLPPELRRHRVGGWDLYENGRDIELGNRTSTHRDVILERLIDSGMEPLQASALSRAIAKVEVLFPELEGLLAIEDFTQINARQYRFEPSAERAAAFFARVKEATPDAFPELRIEPSMDESLLLRDMREFLTEYREAENIFRDGGRDKTHCEWSARLVSHLLLVKGFDAFLVYGSQATYSGPARLKHAQLASIATVLGLRSSFAQTAVAAYREGMDLDRFRNELGTKGRASVNVATAYDIISRMTPNEREALISLEMEERSHFMTAVRLRGAYYLIDIDGQQFGRKYDELRLFPADEAPRHNYVMYMSPSDCLRSIPFQELIAPLGTIYREEQLILAEYLKIL